MYLNPPPCVSHAYRSENNLRDSVCSFCLVGPRDWMWWQTSLPHELSHWFSPPWKYHARQVVVGHKRKLNKHEPEWALRVSPWFLDSWTRVPTLSSPSDELWTGSTRWNKLLPPLSCFWSKCFIMATEWSYDAKCSLVIPFTPITGRCIHLSHPPFPSRTDVSVCGVLHFHHWLTCPLVVLFTLVH